MGIPKSDTLFDLNDLEDDLSAKKPKAGSSVKPRALPLRSGVKKSGKRKAVEMVNLDSVDNASPLDLARALVKHLESSSSKSDDLEALVEQLQDYKKALESEVNLYQDSLKRQDKEIVILQKRVDDAEAKADARVEEIVLKAKKSAIVSVLQAKIKLAEEAASKGVTLWEKEIKEWNKSLEEKTGKKASSGGSDARGKGKEKAADEAGTGEAETDGDGAGDPMEAEAGGEGPEKEVIAGDDGDIAQT